MISTTAIVAARYLVWKSCTQSMEGEGMSYTLARRMLWKSFLLSALREACVTGHILLQMTDTKQSPVLHLRPLERCSAHLSCDL